MAITVNSLSVGRLKFGSRDKWAHSVRQHTQGRAAAWNGAPQGLKPRLGRCTSQWDHGVREGRYHTCKEWKELVWKCRFLAFLLDFPLDFPLDFLFSCFLSCLLSFFLASLPSYFPPFLLSSLLAFLSPCFPPFLLSLFLASLPSFFPSFLLPSFLLPFLLASLLSCLSWVQQ